MTKYMYMYQEAGIRLWSYQNSKINNLYLGIALR